METTFELLKQILRDACEAEDRAESHQRQANEARKEAEELRQAAATIENKYGLVYTGDRTTIDLRDRPAIGAFDAALKVFGDHQGETLSLSKIEQLMFHAGWETTAKDPSATVRNTVKRLSDHGVENNGRGMYRLKTEAETAVETIDLQQIALDEPIIFLDD